jgi:acylphosphatase
MVDVVSVRAIIYGYVQGVFFRVFVTEWAEKLGLRGYVRNLPQGTVEIYAEGSRDRLETLVGYLRKGPPGAGVKSVVTTWSASTGQYSDFRIRY